MKQAGEHPPHNKSGNVFLGYQAGYRTANGSNTNVFLGYQAGYWETGANKLYIENSNSSSPLIYGEFDNEILAFNAKVGIGTTSPSTQLDVSGIVKATSFQGDGSQLTNIETIPQGVIVMWSGSIASISTGWALCNGNNGTPNLTDRFVIHADADAGGTNDVGDTGGSHTVTITEANMPSHRHNISHEHDIWGVQGTGSQLCISLTNMYSAYWEDGMIREYTGYSDWKGGGEATTITPKYYALAYIMKL